MFLWCVQEVAELKEEDIISHTATATQLPTAIAVAVIDVISKTISEFYLLYSKTLHGKVKNVHGNSNYRITGNFRSVLIFVRAPDDEN